MKTPISYFKSISVLFLIFTLSGCEDFLESDPKSFIAPENFYQDRDQATAAANAIYDVLASTGLYGSYHNYITFGDIAANGITQGEVAFDQHTINSSNGILSSMWDASYDGINRANAVIDRVPASQMQEEVKNRILGEAYFLRGLFYFNLVRIFGGVPLHTSEVNSLEKVALAKSSEDEIYQTIVADLEKASESLPIVPTEVGRATQGAAKTLLAKVHLTLGDFEQARNLSKEVMDLGVYELWETYEDVFKVANENGKESVFEVQFRSNAGGEGNSKTFIIPSRLTDLVMNGPVFRDYYLTEDLINLYAPEDQRAATNAVDSLIVGTDTVRFDGTVSIKYLDDSFTTDVQDADNNFIVMRYAEVLLMFAEAENEVAGPTAAAIDAVNQVRRRAFSQDIMSPSDYDLNAGISQAALQQAIWDERFREFPMEGMQWFDLKRTNRLLAIEEIEEYQAVYPIPLREMDINQQMVQNTGY
uniref:RagB/SusD family nutrient uptake outer membrane protein n=1 Tax=Roseihalotalea indica TaxID=2867963 RepID=A0AA49GL21_9BACT|nr:RagB/SusD family nutrient uptake outer membrane protein [Tunicatimonas sp. TK19036]